jgi:hypothetical protein
VRVEREKEEEEVKKQSKNEREGIGHKMACRHHDSAEKGIGGE